MPSVILGCISIDLTSQSCPPNPVATASENNVTFRITSSSNIPEFAKPISHSIQPLSQSLTVSESSVPNPNDVPSEAEVKFNPDAVLQLSLLSKSKITPSKLAVKLITLCCCASTSLITNGTSSTNAVKKKPYSLFTFTFLL